MINDKHSDSKQTELVDDLLWVCAKLLEDGSSFFDLDAIERMLAEYTGDTLMYSDGSPVGTEYRPLYYQAFMPPHRRLYIKNTGENKK
jgi:hypothetical protein